MMGTLLELMHFPEWLEDADDSLTHKHNIHNKIFDSLIGRLHMKPITKSCSSMSPICYL